MKKENGITLIALVITIIVLIILAGVSISLALGDNGLITKAREQQKRQDIVRISEKLEIEKASVATKNLKGIVPIDEYIDYIKGKNIITDGDIERVSEEDVYVIVENYMFLLEQEENNNLKITYQGEASERKPKIESIDISNTTNTISLTVNTKYASNGTYKYYIKDTENGEYEEKSSIKSNQYVYENLEQNKKYYIKVVVLATNNKTSEQEMLRTTGSVEELTDTNTTFTYSPDGWTNGNVTATANTQVTGYTLQTSKDGKDWSNVESQTFNENGTIYARVVDSTGQATGYTSGNVDKIDKTIPQEATSEFNGDNEQINLPVALNAKVTHFDTNSGINITSCKYVINTTSTEIGTDESSYIGGTFSSNQEILPLNLEIQGTYYLHILSVDNTGNKKETIKGPINVEIKYHTHTGSSSSGGGCYTNAVYHTHNSSCPKTWSHKSGCPGDNPTTGRCPNNCSTQNVTYKCGLIGKVVGYSLGCGKSEKYHVHTGSSSSQGGCYTKAVYHTHNSSCQKTWSHITGCPGDDPITGRCPNNCSTQNATYKCGLNGKIIGYALGCGESETCVEAYLITY